MLTLLTGRGNVNSLPVGDYPSNILLAGVTGSTVYGLSTPASDIDTFGIFVAPLSNVLGLNSVAATSKTIVFKNPQPDATFHEVGKYCRLALQGNPTLLELLYLPAYTVQTGAGKQLVELREAFLSTNTVFSAYGGYALSQAKKLAAKSNKGELVANRAAKHGRHCVRLLLQGTQLLVEGKLTLDLGVERDMVFAAGELAVSDRVEFNSFVADKYLEMVNAVKVSILPPEPQRPLVDKWLVDTRQGSV